MKLNQLPKITSKGKKRVGRGIGSGKGGHTSGRGQKGQKSRSKLPPLFEGSKVRKSLIKRLPMKRGKDRFKAYQRKPLIINVKYLDILPRASEVTVDSLIKAGLVNKEAKNTGVKILGDGNLTKNLTVLVPASKGAKQKIEQAGGKVITPSVSEVKPTKKPIKKKAAKTISKK
jgi:large subunit ribosomal protein L15